MFPASRRQSIDLEMGAESGNDHLDPPLSATSSRTPPGGLHFRDTSRPLFTMYSRITEEIDNRMVERWQKVADGILIFAGLFSAVVAQLLSVTIPDLKPSPQTQPQGNSDFYLKNICQGLSHQNDSCQPPPSPFSPSKPAIWVNSLWFLSLVISLTCAMLATFIQRWARRYIGITQSSRYSPHKRARLRGFFFNGVDKWHVSWAVEALPILLHLSLFLFFVGLVIYLFSINHSVFASVVWWVVLSMMAYLCITLLPMFRPDSPYYAPLSSLLWFFYACISCAISEVLSSPVFRRFGSTHRFRRRIYSKRFSENIRKTTAKTALLRSSEIDVHVLESILDALGEDAAWEKFFEAIPGFFESDLVKVHKEDLPDEFRTKFTQALSGFLDCTFSLSSVTESLRGDRLVICLNAAHASLGSDAVSQILQYILNGRWPELLQSVVVGHSLRRWRNSNDEPFHTNVRRIVTRIVVGVRERDSRWFSLVKAEYGIEDHVLRKYIGRGDSVLLFILIHMTRQAFHTDSWTPWILSSLSEFNTRDTSPELQHVFCELWNDIVLKARIENLPSEDGLSEDGPTNIPVQILREVRQVYVTLHQDTDAALTASSAFPHFHPILDQPRSYRLCAVTSHRQSLTINTPVSGSFAVPSVTRSNRSSAASPLHSSPTDSDPTPDGSTASQELEETNITVTIEPPSSADDSPDPSDTHRFTFPPLVNSSVHATQTTPIACPSVHESVNCDPGLFVVPGEAWYDTRTSVPPAAGTYLVQSDPTPLIHISEPGESSPVPTASSLMFQHFGAIPASITPSIGLDPSDDLDALPLLTNLTDSLEANKIVAPCAASDISEISSSVNFIPPSIRTVSPTVVSDCLPSPIPPSVHSSSMTAAEPASIQPDQFLDALRSLSSSLTTASSHISPQVASIFDVQITLRIGTPSPHDETDDLFPPIPTTVHLHLAKTTPPAHDIVAPTLQPEDQVRHDLDKL